MVIRTSMLTHETTPATKTVRVSTAALAVLLWASAHTTPAGAADSANTSPADASLYGYLREARDPSLLQRTARLDEIRRHTDELVRISFDGEPQSTGLPAGAIRIRGQIHTLAAQYHSLVGSVSGASAPVDASSSDLLARLKHGFRSDAGLSSDRTHQGEREVLLTNSDALIRARVRLTLGKEQLGFVYADLGARDSALKWQGLAGIRGGHGVDLLGGWRHVTYRFSPDIGFDLLDFNGPYLGATLAW
jgi:hypothetical protein